MSEPDKPKKRCGDDGSFDTFEVTVWFDDRVWRKRVPDLSPIRVEELLHEVIDAVRTLGMCRSIRVNRRVIKLFQPEKPHEQTPS